MNAANSLGLTAMHGAANRGWVSMMQILADHGAKVDAKDKEGRTPMVFREGNLSRRAASGGKARSHGAAREIVRPRPKQ